MSSTERHNTIVEWIDGCKTHDQLKTLIPFIKNQPLKKESKLKLLDFLSIKNSQLCVNMISDGFKKYLGPLV